MKMHCSTLIVLALLFAAGCPLFGQNAASLTGIVTDPSGAVLVGAAVHLTNVDTNIAQSTQTNQAGLYSFSGVLPGGYSMSVRLAGFKETIKKDLILHVGDAVSLNFAMEIGVPTESVTVTSEAVLVNTEDATVGTVVERQVVENMPLNGRSFQGLITLSPGVATVSTGGGQFVVNGQRTDTSYFSLDGVSSNVASPTLGSLGGQGAGAVPTAAATGGFNNMVSVDGLQEFRISTSSFAPEFGRTPGGQISMVSRGGTNAFHGDVFEYFRNTVLDANDWFLNAAAKARGVVQQNDFGGVIGGPIVKNKLFFFASYEGLRLQAPTPSVKKVPSQSARALAAAANSGGVTGYMAQFANAYPLPDGNPSIPCTTFANCAQNYTASFPGKSVLDATSGRLDYSLSKRLVLFGRYSHSPSSVVTANSVNTVPLDNGNDVYTAALTSLISNAMNNDLRFNFTHTTFVRGQNPTTFTGSLSTIYPSGYAQPPSSYTLDQMAIQVGGLPTDTLIVSPKQANNGNDQVNIADTFAWVKGAHRLKFGADYRELNPSYDQANFNENNQFAQTTTALPGFPSVANVCPASVLPAGAGATVPGYLCGQATLSNLQHLLPQHFRYRQFSFFAQDTWKATRRLTITYGTRWEINPPYQWTSDNPGFSVQDSSFNLADLSHININPLGTPAFATTWGNFSPRIGVAYQVSDNPKWGRVLRAGYGLFYDTGSQVGNVISNPFTARYNNQGAGANISLIQYPISTANSVFVTPVAHRTTLPVGVGGQDNLVDPNFKLPYVHQFNVTLEQQLGGNQTFTASYVGALGRRLIGSSIYPVNVGNPAVFATINSLTGAITPDSLGIFGNYSSSDYHSLQTKFQRQFSHGLSALASYTWSHSVDDASLSGLATTVLPTAARLASGLPNALLRGNSDFDIRHNLALSLVFDLPNPSNPVARAILGHWSFDPIYHYQTAVPLDMLTGSTGSIGGTGYGQRPNLIPGTPVYVYGSDCAAQNGGQGCPGGKQLNIAPVSASAAASAGCVAPTATNAKGAFCTPLLVGAQTVSGNLGRNVVRGAFPLQELDFSIHRDFPFLERFRLRFQADLFNVFNHPSFGPLAFTVNGTTFGTTTLMANSSLGAGNAGGSGFNPIFSTGGPRNFQFAVKLYF